MATIALIGDCAIVDGNCDARLFKAANGRKIGEQEINRTCFGTWDTEDIVVCRVDTNWLEIHCHGGDAAVSRILSDLESAGCQIVSWQEALGEQGGAFEVEMAEAITKATTRRTAGYLIRQKTTFEPAIKRLLDVEDTDKLHAEIAETLKWVKFARHLTQPWQIVLAGRPNVGKSSLINQLVGFERAIVFDEPGTTRDVVSAETALDGWPVCFSDTAGIRDSAAELEATGIELARDRLTAADCQVLVLDVSESPTADDDLLLSSYPESLVVANKDDLPDQWKDHVPQNAIRVSAVNGTGINQLVAAIVSKIIPELPSKDQPLPLVARHIRCLEGAQTASSKAEIHRSIRQILSLT